MKKRHITGLLASGLLASMLPGAVSAQGDAEGTMTWAFALTCDAGQGPAWAVPPCEFDEDTGILTVTILSAERMAGTFDGVQSRAGTLEMAENGDFSYAADVIFAGTVEGCGSGTVYFEAKGEGNNDPSDIATYTSNTYTVVPGGSLPVEGSVETPGTEAPNDDGTETMSYIGTYTCDA